MIAVLRIIQDKGNKQMARKKAKFQDGWNTWETRPIDAVSIIVKLPGGEFVGDYFGEEGINGIVQFEDSVMEIEEHMNDSQWKLNETEPNETKPNQSKQFALNISVEDLHRYVADGLKNDSGVTVLDMWTNKDEGFIVYGSGLGRVAK